MSRTEAGRALGLRSAIARLAASSWMLGTVLAIVSWPVRDLPIVGTDISWRASLHLAAERGLDFGSEIIWTYGPLGFLAIPEPYFGRSSLAAMAFSAAIHIGLCIFLVDAARRALPLAVGLGLAYLAARTLSWTEVPETMLLVAFFSATSVIGQAARRRSAPTTVALLGAFAGIALLGKLSTGIGIVLLGAVAATVGRSRWRGLAIFVGAAGVAGLSAWGLSGQRFVDLPAFVRLSAEIVLGYSAAMGVAGDPTMLWMLAVGPMCFALIGGLAFFGSARWPTDARIGLLLLVAVLGFVCWKAGFTRWHVMFVFVTAVIAVFAVIPISPNRPRNAAAILAVVVLLLAFFAGLRPDAVRYLSPGESVAAFGSQVALAVSPAARGLAVTQARVPMRNAYALTADVLSLLAGRTVHEPAESGVTWAYPDLNWAPVPIFQSYTAYTRDLDAANAAALAGPRAPHYVLREPFYAVDGRHPWFETPQATLELLCRYREVGLFGRWQLLEVGAARCGEPSVDAMVTAATGETIPVLIDPLGDHILAARIHGLEPSLPDRLATLALRGPEWQITLNGAGAFRLVPEHALGPLLLFVPETIGYTPVYSFPGPVETLSVSRVGGQAGEEIVVEFLTIPIQPAAGPVRRYPAALGGLIPVDSTLRAAARGFVDVRVVKWASTRQ